MDKINFIDKFRLVFLLGERVEIHVEEGCNIKGIVTDIRFDGFVRLSTGSRTFYKNCKKIK